MHSIFRTERRLVKSTTALCFGSNTDSIAFKNNGVVINKDITVVSKGCFDEHYIGPGGFIIFKDFIRLEPESITTPLFKEIVFENDGWIDDNAFFSNCVNSNLNKNYILYGPKDSHVKEFAEKNGFAFKELPKFNGSKEGTHYTLVCQYKRNIKISKGSCALSINEDRFIFVKKARKRNADYIYYQSSFIRDQFLKEVESIINRFETDKKYMSYTGTDQKWFYIQLNLLNTKRYMQIFDEVFKNTEVIKYLDCLK